MDRGVPLSIMCQLRYLPLLVDQIWWLEFNRLSRVKHLSPALTSRLHPQLHCRVTVIRVVMVGGTKDRCGDREFTLWPKHHRAQNHCTRSGTARVPGIPGILLPLAVSLVDDRQTPVHHIACHT